jgi:hypothetical protein
MADRHIPVRPNLEQLKHQAKDLLRDVHAGDPAAVAEFRQYGPTSVEPSEAKLAHAQFALARSHGVANWARLATACNMIHAIWENDLNTVRSLVLETPELLKEDARGVKGNWGPPMSYAANLGRDEMIEMLHGLGAEDVQYAFERACLQSKLDTARKLFAMGARPQKDSVMGPCETLSGVGLRFLLDLEAPFTDDKGDPLAPIGLILQTYGRGPKGKHECLEIVHERVKKLPDTPAMAFHRGRIDLLEQHLKRDPALLGRTFPHEEIYPLSLGCSEDKTLALNGTPTEGGTLLHLCADFDEIEIAQWLLEQGADVNATAAIDADGFGGHTALFVCAVSQPFRNGRDKNADFARLLLDHGANPNARASLRKALRDADDETLHEYRDVTPLSWGLRFHDQAWVNPKVLELIRERGGRE